MSLDKTVLEIMEYLGRNGIQICLRYDAYRKNKNWTLIVNNERLADTDDPMEELKTLLREGNR